MAKYNKQISILLALLCSVGATTTSMAKGSLKFVSTEAYLAFKSEVKGKQTVLSRMKFWTKPDPQSQTKALALRIYESEPVQKVLEKINNEVPEFRGENMMEALSAKALCCCVEVATRVQKNLRENDELCKDERDLLFKNAPGHVVNWMEDFVRTTITSSRDSVKELAVKIQELDEKKLNDNERKQRDQMKNKLEKELGILNPTLSEIAVKEEQIELKKNLPNQSKPATTPLGNPSIIETNITELTDQLYCDPRVQEMIKTNQNQKNNRLTTWAQCYDEASKVLKDSAAPNREGKTTISHETYNNAVMSVCGQKPTDGENKPQEGTTINPSKTNTNKKITYSGQRITGTLGVAAGLGFAGGLTIAANQRKKNGNKRQPVRATAPATQITVN